MVQSPASFLIGLSLLAMFIAGIVLIIKGLRRRVERTPPRCARCGFDLRGLPVAAGHEGSRCPECGTELWHPGRVRHERIVRRWRLAAAGGMLVLIALSPEIVRRAASFAGSPDRFTPQWRLAQRVGSEYGDSDAVDELVRRMAAGRAGRSGIDALVETGLAWQAQVAEAKELVIDISMSPVRQSMSEPGERLLWQGAHWTILLEAAVIHGYATSQQRQRFMEQGLLVEVYATGPGTIEVQVISLLGPGFSQRLQVRTAEIAAMRPPGTFSASATAAGGIGAGAAQTWWWRYDLPAGADRAHITWNIDAHQMFDALGNPGRGDELAGDLEIRIPVPWADGEKPRLLRAWQPLAP
jgi:hypothetical protein